MKAVLISIKPKWCELIARGKKTFEFRKTAPDLKTPFKCYIYATKSGRPLVYGSPVPHYRDENLVQTYGYSFKDAERIFGTWNGKVVGEFVCDDIRCRTVGNFIVKEDAEKALEGSCVTEEELYKYLGWRIGTPRYEQKRMFFYAWHISKLDIYVDPVELNEFKPYNRTCYFGDLGLAKPDCEKCKQCNLKKPPQSWCYVEELI